MKYFILGMTLVGCVCAKVTESKAFSTKLSQESVRKVTNAVADWQIANPYTDFPTWDWTQGALWTGMMAHAEGSRDNKYKKYLKKVSADLQYKMGPRVGFADDHCVGQLHLWNYLRDGMPGQLQPTKRVLDFFIERPHTESLKWENVIQFREWAWCDSLFMSPPTLAMLYAATGEMKYLDKMDQLWWRSYDYLFDAESDLYFRDSKYFEKKEKNGAKVFWSRGNGWVFAGLCHVLQYMPHDYPSRPRYIKLLQTMANKLKSLQLEDGSWRAALLDPKSFDSPETSGTAFYTYGFFWGINNGILKESEFLSSATKGWQRLVKNVHADGKLGYVQPIGEDPRNVTFDQTAVYGVGGFLQAGHELEKYLILKDAKVVKITAQNSSDFSRLNEVVELSWSTLKSKNSEITAKNVAVRDGVEGYFLPIQVVDADKDGEPEALLISCDFSPKENRSLEICATGKISPSSTINNLTARFVPERKDDFAWENDRIAFRAYGPALAAEKARGGVDVWTKSVRRPIVNEWYKKDNYHSNNGTGLDGYKVGSSLGCGGVGYLTSKKELVTSPVFSKYEVLEQGPLRLKFKLSYDAVKVDEARVAETRVITMKAGDHYYQVQSSFKVEGDSSGITPVAGVATRHDKDRSFTYSGDFSGYTDKVMNKEGAITTFILNDADALKGRVYKEKHLLKPLAKGLESPISFYTGAIWNKIDAPQRFDALKKLFQMSEETKNPIIIK